MFPFPYDQIPENSDIVIYGAGNVGRSFISQILNTRYYRIVAVLDRRAGQIQIPGISVRDISAVTELTYDYLLIAVDSFDTTLEIRENLLRLGVSGEKIVCAMWGLLKKRVSSLASTSDRLCLHNIGNRLDRRLTRLEVLQYYSIAENYQKLDDEGRSTLKTVQEFCDLGKRVFPEDPFYEEPKETIPDEYTKENLFSDSKGFYSLFGGTRLYWVGMDELEAISYLYSCWFHYERDNPHTYLMPEDDGINIPEGAILADVGAMEGYFGVRHLDRCKKVYFFETEQEWFERLQTGLCDEPKAEVVRAFVGDQTDHLRLDDYFREKEKPTVVKIDVEGADCAVLRGMPELLNSKEPLILLIASYHRQEDWDRMVRILNPLAEHPRFRISHSRGYYWDMPDPKPPFFRRGILRAEKII